MKAKWKLDYYRMTGEKYRNNINSIIRVARSHQIRYMKLWRKCNKKGNLINRIRLYRLSKKYGIEISPNASIGEGLYLGHAFGITVAGGAVIGTNVNLHKGCTIGAENRGKREGCPDIGNRVSIGINSTVVGNIRIGNDVMIAPNAFVNFNVPDHSVVIGNPASIHKKENATQGYIAFCVREEED